MSHQDFLPIFFFFVLFQFWRAQKNILSSLNSRYNKHYYYWYLSCNWQAFMILLKHVLLCYIFIKVHADMYTCSVYSFRKQLLTHLLLEDPWSTWNYNEVTPERFFSELKINIRYISWMIIITFLAFWWISAFWN